MNVFSSSEPYFHTYLNELCRSDTKHLECENGVPAFLLNLIKNLTESEFNYQAVERYEVDAGDAWHVIAYVNMHLTAPPLNAKYSATGYLAAIALFLKNLPYSILKLPEIKNTDSKESEPR